MVVGGCFALLIRVALRDGAACGGSGRARVALGAGVGLLMAFAVLVLREDLIPDDLDLFLPLGLAIGVIVVTAIVILLRHEV